jgi:hypothetical protein
MAEITLIDLVIFPDYCGGTFSGNYYVDPSTREKKYFNTFATEELVERWLQRAREACDDPTRMLIHLRDATNSSGFKYLVDFATFLDTVLPQTGRYFVFNGHRIDNEDLRQRIQEKGLVLATDVCVVGYGHHRGDCVPKIGKQATRQLGLDESLFQELSDLSVGDKLMDRLDVIRQENPALYFHYSDAYIKQLRETRNSRAIIEIFNARKYLFVYCTEEQVREAARSATSKEEFEARIGGQFKGFNFIEDYFRLCDLHGHTP